MFQLDKFIHLRSARECKGSQTERGTRFNWLQNSATPLLRDALQKGNEKFKTEAVPKTKDRLTTGTPASPLYPPLGPSTRGINPSSEQSFHLQETLEGLTGLEGFSCNCYQFFLK